VNLVFLGALTDGMNGEFFDLPTVFDGAKSRSDFLGFFLRENDEMRSFDYLEWILIFQGGFFSFLFGFTTELNMVSFFVLLNFLFLF